MTRAKHRTCKRRGAWSFVYERERLLGIVEQQQDGAWAIIKLGIITSTHATREAAIAALEREAAP